MNAKRKRIFGLAALGMTLFVSAGPTWAGKTTFGQVDINGIPGQAQVAIGSLAAVRYSADSLQRIECQSDTGPFSAWISCWATTSTGRSLGCGSGDEKFLEVVQAITDSSAITFWANPDGTCQDIRVYQGSDILR